MFSCRNSCDSLRVDDEFSTDFKNTSKQGEETTNNWLIIKSSTSLDLSYANDNEMCFICIWIQTDICFVFCFYQEEFSEKGERDLSKHGGNHRDI